MAAMRHPQEYYRPPCEVGLRADKVIHIQAHTKRPPREAGLRANKVVQQDAYNKD